MDIQTSQELRNCPMGKERLIGRKALLKERLYWKKGFVEKHCENVNLVKLLKYEIWLEILKSGNKCEFARYEPIFIFWWIFYRIFTFFGDFFWEMKK